MKLPLPTEPEAIEFDPAQSAVCVIDMQNWDTKPGGFFDLTDQDMTHSQNVVEPIRRVLDAARAAGVLVVYTKNYMPRERSLWPDPTSPRYWKGDAQAQKWTRDPAIERGMCIEGNWGVEIVDELAPREGDVVVPKTVYSGFVRTEMDVILKRRGIRYLFLTGVGTPTCVEATARDAYFYDYWPIVIADCSGAKLRETHDQALLAIKRRYGWVTDSEAFLSALHQHAAQPVGV